ncbi:unnamed protein product [Brachionus calyciflorus]|uniref:Uncharacterized protein n=1 Tax=Brachionus calyciflorus TaxID=104777 RepID=A0A813SSZ2_9BILA|nr:unnamed protein product [Brachionus calyciflorus]
MEVETRHDENTDPNRAHKNDKIEQHKQSLFKKLVEQTNLDQCFSQALFIQAMFKQDLAVLIKLFNFYLEKKQIKMAIDLLFNDVFKNFDINQTNEFDPYLNKFSILIIENLNENASFIVKKLVDDIEEKDQIYFELFKNLSQNMQEFLIIKILDKYRFKFNKYLKLFIESEKKSTPIQPSQQQAELKEFYLNFSQTYQSLYIIKDLLTIFKKFAQEYGLYLIDAFLNVEKHIHSYMVQNSVQLKLDAGLISIERRSLNLIRRVCVLDLIRDISSLIDKIDNRHCYRWIEKCLEFFTKYSICSTQVNVDTNMENGTDDVNISYASTKILSDSEILVSDSVESNETLKNEVVKQIKENLKDLIEYKYEPIGQDQTPYSNVYSLLDEIAKKLDWPPIPDNLKNIEDKMSFLFNLKSKPDKNISVSSLNKQISFYSLTFFFNKLTEFQALNHALFNDQLILSPLFKNEDDTDSIQMTQINPGFNQTISNLIFCIKIWQKFTQHKEFYTIITKCLSNSKLDNLVIYKNFLADYYNSLQWSSTQQIQNCNYNWTNLNGLNLKQKIPILSYLFMHEKNSLKVFFDELIQILNIVKNDDKLHSKFYVQLSLSKNLLDLFELNKQNIIKYFAKLLTEKLYKIFESKKTAAFNITQDDAYLRVLLVLLQSSYNQGLYDHVLLSIRSKKSLDYPNFFEEIYNVQILQDIFGIVNQNNENASEKFKLGQLDANLNEKFLSQINKEYNLESSYDILANLIILNSTLILEIFDKIISI